MREIKFRAYDYTHAKMNYEVLPLGGIASTISPVDDPMGYIQTGLYREPNHSDVMQFTGLTDKHGKEIWEGDIVEAKGFEPEAHIVRFNRGGFCLEPVTGTESHFWSDIKYVEDEHGEVIGNIYQNSHLLDNK